MKKSSISIIFICITAIFISVGTMIGGKAGLPLSAAALCFAVIALIVAIQNGRKEK